MDDQSHRRYVVFTGPTLRQEEARQVLDAVYLPPAAQGSIVRAVQRFNPAAILIIDGSFQMEPAVRHKEILWSLARGIPVVGAASMGALRAAELFPYMQGSGLIYRWYRRFAFAPDDAVAVLHGPPEIASAPLTLAYVDLRITFRSAERSGVIDAGFRKILDEVARSLNFRDRTMTKVVDRALAAAPFRTGRRAHEWVRLLEASFVSQKKKDALDALLQLKSGVFKLQLPPPFRLTAAFARDLEHAGITLG